jgi:hypothetical protein
MIGAKTNWPSEPPALITPEAVPRASSGTRRAAAPISTEKLPGPGAHRRKAGRARTIRPMPEPHEGGQRAADRQHHQAADQHGARTVAVGDRAGHRLHGALGELPHGEGEG